MRAIPRSARPRTEETALTFLRAAGRLYHEVERALEPMGLTYRDYRALERLGADSSWGRTAVSRPETTAQSPEPGAVERLERAGLVRRISDRDATTVRVERTVLGAARLREAAERLDALVARFGSLLEAGDRAGMDRLLARVGRTDGPW